MREYLDPLQFKKPLILDIGSGAVGADADKFTSVDLYTKADITATMWDIPLPDNSVDGIISLGALEHVSKFDVVPTLREWYRLLRNGGQLLLDVPDLEWTVTYWLSRKDSPDAMSWPMDIIYGNQNHEGEYHQTGFTIPILYTYLQVSANWFVHELDFVPDTGITTPDIIQKIIRLKAEKRDS